MGAGMVWIVQYAVTIFSTCYVIIYYDMIGQHYFPQLVTLLISQCVVCAYNNSVLIAILHLITNACVLVFARAIKSIHMSVIMNQATKNIGR